MTTPIDMELRKAFVELQSKMVATSKKIQVIDTQIEVLNSVLKHIKLTQMEVGHVPPETKVYDCVGRAFFQTDMNSIKNNMYNKENTVISRKAELESNKEYLERKLRESQDNIREMVQQRKEQSEVKSN